MDSIIIWQVGLGCIREPVTHASVRSQQAASSMIFGFSFLFESALLLSMMDCDLECKPNKPNLSLIALIKVFVVATE